MYPASVEDIVHQILVILFENTRKMGFCGLGGVIHTFLFSFYTRKMIEINNVWEVKRDVCG